MSTITPGTENFTTEELTRLAATRLHDAATESYREPTRETLNRAIALARRAVELLEAARGNLA